MVIKKDMNTQEKMERLKDILSDTLEDIKEFQDNDLIYKETDIFGNDKNMHNLEISELWIFNQITSIIYATKELTEINMSMINDYLISEINLNYDDLLELEDSLMGLV